jgi:hypothetical protein
MASLQALTLHTNELADVKGLDALSGVHRPLCPRGNFCGRLRVGDGPRVERSAAASLAGAQARARLTRREAQVAELDLSFNKIADLEGLPKGGKLTKLVLMSNELEDVRAPPRLPPRRGSARVTLGARSAAADGPAGQAGGDRAGDAGDARLQVRGRAGPRPRAAPRPDPPGALPPPPLVLSGHAASLTPY